MEDAGPNKKKIAKVTQALTAARLDYDLALTKAPGHGIELAQQAAAEGWPIVVAGGGDGTIGEVVNGLLNQAGAGEAGILGIIPLGTANDLADMFDLTQYP